MMDIPTAPRFSLAAIGPGLVLVAMGLGSGEFILWPYLVAQYGFGILWGSVIGMTTQYIVSNESARYTLATGGSVYTAFYKLHKLIPLWFIVSTFASFAWPGIIFSAGTIVNHLTGLDPKLITIVLILLIGIVLTFGGSVYNSLENFQKIALVISIPVLCIIAAILVNPTLMLDLAKGFAGIGDGYTFVPGGISIMAFLGSIAYTGAAGNLVLSHSFYVQDEKLGMSQNLNSAVHRKNNSKDIPEGTLFKLTKENINRFNTWLRYTAIEQFISFWFVGLLSIVLLAIIAFALVYPFVGEEGLAFIYLQGEQLGAVLHPVLGIAFLVIGALFLFTTQLGIFETTSRIMTENIQLLSSTVRARFSRSNIFFVCLWVQIIAAIGISLLDVAQPVQLILISTFFSAISMLVLSILVLVLNTSKYLPKEIHIGGWRKFIVLASIVCYLGFVILTTIDILSQYN